jgi:tripartite-type tricarboxylate transporter receptor subunit TctC
MLIGRAANSLPPARAGTIKAYAVTAKNRLAAVPDIPTVDEAESQKVAPTQLHGFQLALV